jgi:hypothetical protein
MITLSFVIFGFAVLLSQQAFMALRDEWDQINQLCDSIAHKPFQGRYRPHPRFRVVSRY